jgi:hypothetical protein
VNWELDGSRFYELRSALPQWTTRKKRINPQRAHLAVSLSIDPEDFETVPVLLDSGGWKPADRVFGGCLGELLREINIAMAA